MSRGASEYAAAGVDAERVDVGLRRLIARIQQTWPASGALGAVLLPVGYYANVVDVGGIGIAFTTDGVGTKVLIAEMMHRYDTIGIDCVAMNVNDLVCVGATPLSMVDYLAVQEANPDLLDQISIGLCEGARQAGVSIPGGEVAQMRELIGGVRDGFGFDLAGAAIGVVPLDRVLVGQDLQEGDILIGLESNGIHSNGLTLARRVLLQDGGLTLDTSVPSLGHSLGEELLKPTFIYVPEAVEILRSNARVKAMFHITGDGLLNLARVASPMGFVLDHLPPTPPLFHVIQEMGEVADEEMYAVFNMGVGFCIAVAPEDADKVTVITESHGRRPHRIGRAVHDEQHRIFVEPRGIVGQGKRFTPA